MSPPPSDFSRFKKLYYFSPDYKVAQYYAAYAKRRFNSSGQVVIICIRITNAAIEGLSPPDIQKIFWPSNEWKELVWRCRTEKTLPSYLRKYHQAILIIGTASQKPNGVYHAMNSWEEITERHLLRAGDVGSGNGDIQYAFSGDDDVTNFLTDHIQDVKVFSYPEAALEAWLVEHTL